LKPRRDLVWRWKAKAVIEEKIEHFKLTGNARKLSIYEAKLATYAKQLVRVQKLSLWQKIVQFLRQWKKRPFLKD
jgi:hypothetical protein